MIRDCRSNQDSFSRRAAPPAVLARFIIVLVVFLLAFSRLAAAQGTNPRPLVTQSVDESKLTRLVGNTHPLARAEFDRGPAPPDLALNRMLLVLKRTDEQEAALQSILNEQQDKSSANYHNWLTPDQYGRQFGPADQDIQAVTLWLQSHGFQLSGASKGRMFIEFSGTASQVKEAFHTEIHKYVVNGEEHWANETDPLIPISLSPAISGIASLHNFRKKPTYRIAGVFAGSKEAGPGKQVRPQDTITCGFNGATGQNILCYGVGPYDFATIYNVLPLWNAASPIDGTGQTIAIVARTNIHPQDVADFQALFGLPPNPPQIILDGNDPGFVSGDETESDLDVEWSGAVAKGATIKLIASQSTETTDGVDLSAAYIVDNNIAPVMSESYGLCELFLGASGNEFEKNLWQQAAAQGITVFVSTGDNGSADCDFDDGHPPSPATNGLQVSGLASTPYNIAVGGTDFDDVFNGATYWNSVSDPKTLESAKGYVPETTWNNSCTNNLFGDPRIGLSTDPETNCNDPRLADLVIPVAGSGGKSGCTTPTGVTPSTCTGGYAKPLWQIGPGVPSDGARDIPDVSLFASSGFQGNFYIMCEADISFGSCSTSNYIEIGGTSASTPAFAGLLALVNQKTGARQGNANYVLYKLASNQSASGCNSSAGPASTCVFNDVTAGNIAMPCAAGSANCTPSRPGDQFGVLPGYQTGVGYDLATGLGSVNANNLVNNWNTVSFTPSSTTLMLNSGQAVNITHGTPVSVGISVSPTSPQPTGDVSLITVQGGSSPGFAIFTLNNGTTSGTTNSLPGGASYSVQAHYEGDGTYSSSDSTPVIVTVNPETSKTDVHVETFDLTTGNVSNPNANSVPYGSVNLLRADVTNSSGTTCIDSATKIVAYSCPSGAVTLADNGAPLGSGIFNLNSQGFAEYQSLQLTGGVHNLSGAYSGDNSYSANAGIDTVTVTAAPTVAFIESGSSPETVVIGTPTTIFTGARTINYGIFAIPPGGTISMFDGTTPLTESIYYLTGVIYPGPGSPYVYELINGIATVTIPPPAGPHSLTINYSGDANYMASTSTPVTVNAVYATQVMLGASAATITDGQSVTFTAKVIPAQMAGSAVSGNIAFQLNGNILATVPLTNSQAQFTTSLLPGGNLSIVASYSGDSNYATSSGTFDEVVTPVSTSTTVTSSNLSTTPGMVVTLTAQITPAQMGSAPAAGQVIFTSNGNTIGVPNVVNNQAQVSLEFTSAGTFQIIASYTGDANYMASSATLTETITLPPTFIISANPPTIVIPSPGQSGSTQLTFSAQNGLTGSATLLPSMCSNLPSESICSFSPSTVTFTSSTTSVPITITVSTTAPSAGASSAVTIMPVSLHISPEIELMTAFCFTLLLFLIRGRSRRWRTIVAFIAIAAASLATGCSGGGGVGGGGGGGGNPGTPVGNYSGVTVRVTINGVTQAINNLTVSVQ